MTGGFIAKGLVPITRTEMADLYRRADDPRRRSPWSSTRTVNFRATSRRKKLKAKKRAGYLAPLAKPYTLTLLFIAMTGALAGLLIDVQFYISATSASMGSKGNANFFANFYIMLNFSSLLLQLFATPKIQDKIGVGGGLMVLPFALIGGAGFASAAATAFSLPVLRVTEGGLRSSVHRSIWEQAFIPVDSSERSLVKIAVDGIGARIAEGIGAAGFMSGCSTSPPAALSQGRWIRDGWPGLL